MQVIAIVSGGMDSVTLAHHLAAEGHDLTIVSFDYGQRHSRELLFARSAADRLGVEHVIVPLDIGHLLTGSALTDPAVEVPEGHYEWEGMKATVVPNRNAIMLSVAAGIAVARGAGCVATAVHAGDHAVYPDCRPEFIEAISKALELGNEGFAVPGFKVTAPFVHKSKAGIAALGEGLGVPWHFTWSCYKGGAEHCGRCSTCVERLEALAAADAHDETVYEDPAYWRTVVTV